MYSTAAVRLCGPAAGDRWVLLGERVRGVLGLERVWREVRGECEPADLRASSSVRSCLPALSPVDPDASSVCSLITEGGVACEVTRPEDRVPEGEGCTDRDWDVCVVDWVWMANN